MNKRNVNIIIYKYNNLYYVTDNQYVPSRNEEILQLEMVLVAFFFWQAVDNKGKQLLWLRYMNKGVAGDSLVYTGFN